MIVGQAAHPVCQHLDGRAGHVGGPHGDHSLSMAQQADSILGVMPQHTTRAHLGSVLCNDLASTSVLQHTDTHTHAHTPKGAAQLCIVVDDCVWLCMIVQ